LPRNRRLGNLNFSASTRPIRNIATPELLLSFGDIGWIRES